MRQPFLLGAFVYIALVAGRISNGNELITAKDDGEVQNKQQGPKGQNLATANPIIRSKRVTTDPEDITFWANRGRRSQPDQAPIQQPSTLEDQQTYLDYLDYLSTFYEKRNMDGPFWGNRGKRPYEEEDLFEVNNEFGVLNKSKKDDSVEPFWGNRGRRSDLKMNDDTNIFWGNRGRRSDEVLYKRSENGPFWGNRGKKESNNKKEMDELPFWGNRGKRDGQNDAFNKFWGAWGKKDVAEPFWGNRGKKEDENPFWGNRGKRNTDGPFWGNRGKKSDENENVEYNPLFRNILVNKFIKNIMRKIKEKNELLINKSNEDYEYDPQDKVLIYADKNFS